MSKFLGRWTTFRRSRDRNEHPTHDKKEDTSDGTTERRAPKKKTKRQWRHSVYGYPGHTAAPAGLDEGVGQPMAITLPLESLPSPTAPHPSPSSSISSLSRRPTQLGRERSRSFSSESSTSFELFPIAEGGLCYTWDSNSATPLRSSGLNLPPLPPRRTTRSASVPVVQSTEANEKHSTEPQRQQHHHHNQQQQEQPSRNEGANDASQRRLPSEKAHERIERTPRGGLPGLGPAAASTSSLTNDDDDDANKGFGHGSGDDDDSEEEDNGRLVPLPEENRVLSSDYLWGIVKDVPPDHDSDSDVEAADDATEADLDDDDDDELFSTPRDKDPGVGAPVAAAATAVATATVLAKEKEKEKESGEHQHQQGAHGSDPKKDTAGKVHKKKRLSLRIFASEPHAAGPSDGASGHQGSSFSRVVNMLTRGGSHTALPGAATSPTTNHVNYTAADAASGTATQPPHSPTSAPRDIHAASMLAAIGSGHYSSFAPPRHTRMSSSPPMASRNGVATRRHTENSSPSSSLLSSLSSSSGAPASFPPVPELGADTRHGTSSSGRRWNRSLAYRTKRATMGALAVPPENHPLPDEAALRRLRPASCSLEELLNVSRTDGSSTSPTAAPPTVTRPPASDRERDKEALRSGRPLTNSAYRRASMLINVGSGNVARHRAKFNADLSGEAGAAAPLSPSSSPSSSSLVDEASKSGADAEQGHLHSSASALLNLAEQQDRRSKDNDWRRSWSPSLLGSSSDSGSSSSSSTTTDASSNSLHPPTVPREPSPRGRSSTLDVASSAQVKEGGDRRVYMLLMDLKLMKYWPTFHHEEILLEDLDGMQEKDLIVDFAMTKWHAKRLLKAVEQLRAISPSPLALSRGASASAGLAGGVVVSSAFGSAAAPSGGAPEKAFPPQPADAAPSATDSHHHHHHHPQHQQQHQQHQPTPRDANAVAAATAEKKSRDKKKKSSKAKAKAMSKKAKKARKEMKREREKIEKEWEQLRQEREKLAVERTVEAAQPKDKKSIADLDFRELCAADIEWDDTKVWAHGRFGVVYRGRWRGVECAIKQLRVDVTAESEEIDRLLRAFKKEASLMQALGYHPNCICFFGAVTLDGRLCLVSEWAANGSVYDLLVKKKKEVSFKTLVKLARDAACGILHLHSEKVIHRDIAARNVLVGQDYTGKISDLGLSRVMTTTMTSDSASSNIGAIKWMSPESITTNQYNEKSDAFSFGVFLWEMLTRDTPWGSTPAMQVALMVVNEGKRLEPPENCASVLRDLMAKCFAADPQERPDFHEIFATLNNYYRELDKADQEGRRSGELLVGVPSVGGAAVSATALPQRPSTLLRLSLSDESEDSDDSSSSSSSEDESDEQEMILQYARVGGGGDVHNMLSGLAAPGGVGGIVAGDSSSDDSDSDDVGEEFRNANARYGHAP